MAGQLRGPGDGVPGGRVDSAPPAARAAVLVREERADLGLSGITSAEDADPRALKLSGYCQERVVKRLLIVAGLMEVRFRQFVYSAGARLR